MDNEFYTTPDEVIDVYRYGQKRGFIAGIAFCMAAKWMLDRRREDQVVKDRRFWANRNP